MKGEREGKGRVNMLSTRSVSSPAIPTTATTENRYKRRASPFHDGAKLSKKKEQKEQQRSQSRLRSLLFRLLFIREPSLSKKNDVARISVAQAPPPRTAAPATPTPTLIKNDSPPQINFSKPLRRAPLNHRHSTFGELDDAQSTAYRSDASSESSTSDSRTMCKSITSHDSGFFEALEFPSSKLLSRFQHTRKVSLSRSTSASTIYHTPASPIITPNQQAALLSCLRDLRQILTSQEVLTNRLSKNLAHLFGIKETQISYLRSVSDDAKERAIIALTRLRLLVGKALVRKTVLTQRGGTMLTWLEAHTAGKDSALSTPLEMMSGPIGALTLASRSTPSVLPTAPAASANTRWDIPHIETLLVALRTDVETQQALDAALRQGILGPVRNFRYYKMAVQERVQMRQFATFVEEELARGERVYRAWDVSLGRVDGVLGSIV